MKSNKYSLIILAGLILLLAACTTNNENEARGDDQVDKLEGYWEGTIQVPDQPLPITVKFENGEGKLSIPVQGLHDYPFNKVELTEAELLLAMDLQGQRLTFEGEVEEEKISGTFAQQGQSFPFELVLGNKDAHEPELGEQVEIDVPGGSMLAVLETPEEGSSFPVAIIIAGSGPTDKDGNSITIPGENNSLKMLSEAFVAEGIAAIRYDKRGVGDNIGLAGEEEEARFDDYINDAAAWIAYAKNEDLFSSVNVVGHSEGSLVGMVASNKENVDAFVSVAGAGRPIDEVLLNQLEAQLSDDLLEESKKIVAKLKQGETVQSVPPELQSVFRPSIQPYMISWLEFDPQEEVAKLDTSVLVVNGTRDLQVPASEAEILHEAKKDSELLIVENMNHVLKDAPEDEEGNMATYSQPDLPLSDGLVEPIIDLIKN